MTRNDIIAEYIKQNYPEILATTDFAIFQFRIACISFSDAVRKSIRSVDFSKLKETLKSLSKKER